MNTITIWVLTTMFLNLNTLAPHQEVRIFSNQSACIIAQRITPPAPRNHIAFVMNSCRKESVRLPFTK